MAKMDKKWSKGLYKMIIIYKYIFKTKSIDKIIHNLYIYIYI